MADELARLLRIKTGTASRLRREVVMYTQDAIKESKKVENLRAKDADPHDIKYAETLLTEAKAMVPDACARLEAAVADLSKFLVRFGRAKKEELREGDVPSEVASKSREELELARAVLV